MLGWGWSGRKSIKRKVFDRTGRDLQLVRSIFIGLTRRKVLLSIM